GLLPVRRRPPDDAARAAGPRPGGSAGRAAPALARAHRTGTAVGATLTPVTPASDDDTAGRRTPMRVLRLVGGRRPDSTPTPEAPPREPRPVPAAQVVAGCLLLVTGLLIAFAAYLVVVSSLAANRAQDVLY